VPEGLPSSSSKSPPLDPVPRLLRLNADLLARLEALEARVGGKAIDDRGQPTAARPPPAEDTSIRCYTVRETARILRLSVSQTYANITKGHIPAVKLGGRLLIPHTGIVRLLEGERGARLPGEHRQEKYRDD